MKEWITIKDLSSALDVTRRAIQKRAAEKGWPGREVPNPKGGRAIKEFRISCLPREDQEAVARYWLRQKLDSSGMEIIPPSGIVSASAKHPMSASAPTPCLSNPADLTNTGPTFTGSTRTNSSNSGSSDSGLARTGTTNTDLTNTNKHVAVPERSNSVGLAKYNLVAAWREVLETQPHGRKVEATESFLLAYNSGRLLPNVFAKVGQVAPSTLRDMSKLLRQSRETNNGNEDYTVLCDGRGGWKLHGTTRWRERTLSDEAKDVFLSCWLQPEQPTVSLAIRAARMTLERRGIIEQADDRTWRRWLDDWSRRSQHVIVLAREGEKAYRDKIGPYITRDDSMLSPGQVLIADGHDLNFEILHPYTGRPARLKLVMFFDWASRMPAGWQIMPTENTVVIQAALRNALINLGRLPQVVYLDNGRAFRAKVFTETDPDLTELSGLYARLGIATQFSQPYNARAKIIERFFETLNEQFERLMASYTGASISDKPAWRQRNEKFHRARHIKRTGGWIPDIREAAWLINLYVQWYGQQEHSGIHWQKPAEVLAAGRGPGLNIAELNDQFLWSKKVTTRHCRVTLFNVDYESDCLHGYGDQVIVKYDCSDLSKVWFHTLTGEYLGEGEPVQALNPIARQLGDRVGVAEVQSAIERQRRLAKQTKAGLLELGASAEQADSLSSLPWREKVAVLPGGKTEDAKRSSAEVDTPLLREERARLELVASRAEAEIRDTEERGPELERPDSFPSPAARYDWCWRARWEHKGELTHEEAAFMAWFESTAEFSEYRQRYEDLKLIYCG